MEAHTTDLNCQICHRNFYTKLALAMHVQSHQVYKITILAYTKLVTFVANVLIA